LTVDESPNYNKSISEEAGKCGLKPIVRAQNLSKVYQMGEVVVHALNEVSFELFRGELLVILGPSGSGKSTLLNIIGGMDTASSGEIYYLDLPLHEADTNRLTYYRRDHVGFVFQFYNLMPSLTAYENVSLAAEIAQNPLSENEMLEKVGLLNRADHFPAQLSGGEQQRVALARALVKNPEMLLCDEPTGALDFERSIQVLKLLRDFCDNYKKTVLVITHNHAIAEIADRVFYMRDGRLIRVEVNKSPLPPEKVTW